MKPTHTLLFLAFTAHTFAQCPTFTMTGNYQEFTYCGGENAEPWDSNTPCGTYTHYYTVEFEAQIPYTTITVTSQMNYTFAPFTPWNWAHLNVIEECGGAQVWNTSNFACGVGSEIAIGGTCCGANYFVDLVLPPGTYYLVFGYAMQPDQFGCVTVGIGNPTFLNLGDEDQERPHQEATRLPFQRPRKIYHPRYGILIEHPNGRVTDLMNRTLNLRE